MAFSAYPYDFPALAFPISNCTRLPPHHITLKLFSTATERDTLQIPEIVIIGAGLSGLRTATLLAEAGQDAVILEGASHLGGRIVSLDAIPSRAALSGASGRVDMGPAWVWPSMQPRMRRLLSHLGVTAYKQQASGDTLLERSVLSPPQRVATYTQEPPSFRVAGGMATVVERLVAQLSPGQIYLDRRVVRVESGDDAVTVHALSANGSVTTICCRRLVIALPPRLAAESVTFSPALPPPVEQAMRQTPTWMAGQAKYVAVYSRPFWRDAGLSGAARSAIGPLVEIHDASIPDGAAALFGFVGLTAAQRQAAGAAWESAALAQLVRLFGVEAGNPVAVHVKDWAQSPLTATAQDWPPLNAHPHYAALPESGSVWRDRLVWAGTETASDHGGYLEGALEAAERAVAALASNAASSHRPDARLHSGCGKGHHHT